MNSCGSSLSLRSMGYEYVNRNPMRDMCNVWNSSQSYPLTFGKPILCTIVPWHPLHTLARGRVAFPGSLQRSKQDHWSSCVTLRLGSSSCICFSLFIFAGEAELSTVRSEGRAEEQQSDHPPVLEYSCSTGQWRAGDNAEAS